MLISSIEYQSSSMTEPQILRLQKGHGRFLNVVAVDAQSLNVEMLQDLIQFCLVGRASKDLSSVTIIFHDHAGDEWKVTRKNNKKMLWRNHKPISEDQFESSILAAMLDLDATLNPQESLQGLAQTKHIYWCDKGEMKARPCLDHLARSSDIRGLIAKKTNALYKECENIIGVLKADKPKALLSLVQRIRPLYYSWIELNRQKKEIDLDQDIDLLRPEQIDNFEKEIHLLKQIEKYSATLVDPKESPMVINQKLKSIEVKLRDLSREIELGHTSLKLSAAIPWSKVLECLTRVEAYRGLVSASEKALQDHESLVKPAVEEHIETLSNLVAKNTDITAELESCLTSLTLHQRRKDEYENAKTSRKLTRMMRNFVNAAPLDSMENEPKGIEEARLAVDHALCKMGEIKSEVDTSLTVLSGAADVLYGRHEMLVDKYGKLKSYWREISTKYHLPVDLKISEALKLMTSHGRMHDLLQLRERYRKIMQERQEKLNAIRDLIEDWRHLIGSQKSTPLANENILLSEANALLELRPKKERQYEKFKQDADRFKALSFLLQQLTERQMSIVEKWERAFDSAGFRSHPIQDGNWLRVFERLDAIRTLESIGNDSSKDVSGEDIFAAEQNEYPINIYSIDEANQKQKIEFINSLAQQHCSSLILLSTQDRAFLDTIYKLGVGLLKMMPMLSKPAPESVKASQVNPSRQAQAPQAQMRGAAAISPASQRDIGKRQSVEEVLKIFQGPIR